MYGCSIGMAVGKLELSVQQGSFDLTRREAPGEGRKTRQTPNFQKHVFQRELRDSRVERRCRLSERVAV